MFVLLVAVVIDVDIVAVVIVAVVDFGRSVVTIVAEKQNKTLFMFDSTIFEDSKLKRGFAS